MKIEGRNIKGVFQERPNRFLALVKVENRILPSFLPNPGRMYELLTPGTEVILREVLRENRKTDFDLIGVFYNGQIVSVDSRVPNKLVLEALKNRDIEELSEYNIIKPEYGYGHSRFDFLLANEHERCLLEAKSCTLVKDGVAMFPDAETERGRRHVRELVKARKEGYRACVMFIVQRTDAHVFVPNDETDPEFGKVLRGAAVEGVEVYAYCSEFFENKITLKGKIKVELEPHQDS
ncbi:MAG: DNA/RNA nuclease SfsA [Candidatus Bathyarchaeota archaeon]|nr:MAG: DNA/RNA nuclease SfsA [Candidatus Bathyarchaeota archaeon]